MYYFIEMYPKTEDNNNLYYIEFSQFRVEDKMEWRLFKRNFYSSREEWEKTSHYFLEQREVHPYQIANGEVNINDNAFDLNTKSFLKFLVDSLNKNSEKVS